MRKKLLKLALILLAIGAVALLLTYFCFHFVTDEGITLTWHAEAGKPFVTLFLGVFGVTLIAGSVVSLVTACVIFDKEDNK